jgi:hypothetical protein
MLAIFVWTFAVAALLAACVMLFASAPPKDSKLPPRLGLALLGLAFFSFSVFLMWHGLNLFYFNSWHHSFGLKPNFPI